MSARPKAIDLFCGAGGLSLGLSSAGFEVAIGVDNDARSIETYNHNLGQHGLHISISGLSGTELLSRAGISREDCVLLAGGPPCQGFSIQRRGEASDPRNQLVLEFLRIVSEIQPPFFLIENVSGLTSHRAGKVFDEVLRKARALGYCPHLKKMDAADYGVPQRRLRVILVGERLTGSGLSFRYPEATTPAPRHVNVKAAIGDLPSPPEDGSPHPMVPNHAREARLSEKNLLRISHIPQGGGREHLPDHLQLNCHRNNPGHRHLDVYGRLHWDEPSVTITARFDSFTRGRFGHPEDHRSLTIREGARLQTFPDDFVFFGNREECARQVGNAVPPKMAAAIGMALMEALRRHSTDDLPPETQLLLPHIAAL
jgi:DNA (cytosine-5)-methyltransferase 1